MTKNNIYLISNFKFLIRIDKFISYSIKELSRSNIKNLIHFGNVFINNNNVFYPKVKVKYGDKINIILPKLNNNKIIPEYIKLNIIYEDDHILILNKQSNLAVHPSAGNFNNTLLNGLLYYNPYIKNITRYGIVHRLDKNTTGLIITAKSELSFNKLKNMIFLKKIIKEYDAIICGSIISGGVIKYPISKHKNKKIMTINFNNGKEAITHYRIIKKFNLHTHIKVRLETGRTHQIRVHMSYINHPLVGDNIYSNNSSNYKKSLFYLKSKNIIFNRQALNASRLVFNHPITNKKLEFNTNLPIDMKILLKNLY